MLFTRPAPRGSHASFLPIRASRLSRVKREPEKETVLQCKFCKIQYELTLFLSKYSLKGTVGEACKYNFRQKISHFCYPIKEQRKHPRALRRLSRHHDTTLLSNFGTNISGLVSSRRPKFSINWYSDLYLTQSEGTTSLNFEFIVLKASVSLSIFQFNTSIFTLSIVSLCTFPLSLLESKTKRKEKGN